MSVQGPPGEWYRFGTVKVANSSLSGGVDVLFGTGRLGTTEVKGSRVSSHTAFRILTGTSGSCTAEKNVYQSPVRQICP